MNLRPLLCCFALTGVAVNPAFAESAPAAKPDKAVAPAAKTNEKAPTDIGPEVALKKGMTAAEVVKIMGGTPLSVRPIEAPSGKAEVWTYQRRTYGSIDRIQVGSQPIIVKVKGSDGAFRDQVVGNEPIYKNQRHVTEETVNLLMFDDQYVVAKVAIAKRTELE